MKLTKLSATSVDRWLDCPASWRAYYQTDNRPSELAGSPALLGSVCHETLENWVSHRHHLAGYDDVTAEMKMRDLYHAAYRKIFGASGDRYQEGVELCLGWLARTSFEGVKVLGVELEDLWEFHVDDEPVRIHAIMDRVDRNADGELEVVDYKTSVIRLSPDDLHGKTQPRLYAWVASKIWGEDGVWVTFDQLRHQRISSYFTAEDHERTEDFLASVVRDIRTTTTPQETLNSRCQWCIRRHECSTLSHHVRAGGPLALNDPDDVVAKRYETHAVIKGLEARLQDYDDYLREHGEQNEMTEWITEDHKVTLWQGARSKRPTVRVAPL